MTIRGRKRLGTKPIPVLLMAYRIRGAAPHGRAGEAAAGAQTSFKNLHLNMRIAAENHFLSPDVWRLNGGAPDLSVFEDAPVFGGLDRAPGRI